jgi:hypothetical protein
MPVSVVMVVVWSQGIQDMLVQYLQLVLGFTTRDQSLLFTILGGTQMIVQAVLLPILVARLGERRLLVLGLVFSFTEQVWFVSKLTGQLLCCSWSNCDIIVHGVGWLPIIILLLPLWWSVLVIERGDSQAHHGIDHMTVWAWCVCLAVAGLSCIICGKVAGVCCCGSGQYGGGVFPSYQQHQVHP